MKVTGLVLLTLLEGLLLSQQGLAAEKTVTLKIETMMCGADPHIVRSSLQAVEGVRGVAISLADKTARVSYDTSNTTLDQLLIATSSAGYSSIPQN